MKAFLNKLFTLMFGSAVGQIAAAAAAPILSRLFTPEDYGVSGLVLSVSMMLVFVGTMRYEAVIVSGKTNTSRGNAFVLAGAILIVVTLSLVLVLCVLWFLSAKSILPQNTVTAIYLFAPLLLLLSVGQVRLFPPLLIQHGHYQLVALGNFLGAALGALMQIAFGFVGAGPVGLLLGRVVGLTLAIIASAGPTFSKLILPVINASRIRNMSKVACAYRGQATLLAPAGFVNTFTTQLPVFVIAAVFSTGSSGAYFFTQALANAAFAVFSKAVTALSAKEALERRASRRPIGPFMLRFTLLVFVATFCCSAVMFVVAEDLIPIVFEERWHEAGLIAKWLSVYYAAAVVHLPLSALSTLLKFQRTMLFTQVVQLVMMILALFVGAISDDLELTIALISIFGAAVYMANMGVIFQVIKRDDEQRDASNCASRRSCSRDKPNTEF